MLSPTKSAKNQSYKVIEPFDLFFFTGPCLIIIIFIIFLIMLLYDYAYGNKDG